MIEEGDAMWGSHYLEFEFELLIFTIEIVKDVRSDSDDGDPSSKHGDVSLKLLQSHSLIRLPHKHSWKHFFFATEFRTEN